jgi:aminoglycoside phosphotransferase (APT) family kinase protein
MSEEYFDRLVDEDALRAFLTDELGPADGFGVQRHEEGHSNETLFVTWGDRELVVRRPPPGETAETAHDVLREYRVINALQETDVPVPPTVTACEDHGVIGSDFYVMDRVHGTVIRGEEPDAVTHSDARERLGSELIETLASIHDLDYESVGLGEMGRPAGYTERQVERWQKQLMWAFDVTAAEREVPTLYRVGKWLSEHCPTDHPHTLVHGDFKLDNMLFQTDPVDLAAVLDWELWALGDPRTDLGWMLAHWRDGHDPEPAMGEYTTQFMEHEEYATRAELVDRWESATGDSFEHERFYRALAVYKLAGLGEMFFRRYLEGNADDPFYPKMEHAVPALGDRAVRIIEGEEPL